MKKKLVFSILGKFMLIEAALLLLSSIVALIYKEMNVAISFWITAAISAVIGKSLCLLRPKNSELYAKEGLMIIGLVWIFWSLVGALPFYISREIPRYIDCFFETVSGFTTTGASILTDIESMSKGMLFWRSFTHWIGGMGVLVFAMAIMPLADKNALHLMRAEVPGPAVSKLVPRGMRNAKILYGIYILLCVIEFVMLVCGGMPVYDSIIHTFSTAGTGGFSCKNASIGTYGSPYIEWVITVFMLLFSLNFNLFYFLLIKKFSSVWKNSEWKIFIAIVIIATAFLSFDIRGIYPSPGDTIRTAAFQVAAIISTTGFCTADFNLWSGFAKVVIIALMFIGACAGSTGGGLKISRLIILAKNATRTLRVVWRPNTIHNIKVDGKTIEDDTVRATSGYFIIYMAIFSISWLVVSFGPLTFEESLSSVATCLNNVGPGFGSLGPTGNFYQINDISKILLSLNMLLGRLEIFPILMLFMPSVWRKKFI